MSKMIAFCGLDCGACPGYIATKNDDNEARAKIAEQWSNEFKSEFKIEDINCDGCTDMAGRHIGYCAQCAIRKCASAKGVENCAYCPDYACETAEGFFKMAPQAKANLEEIRKTL